VHLNVSLENWICRVLENKYTFRKYKVRTGGSKLTHKIKGSKKGSQPNKQGNKNLK